MKSSTKILIGIVCIAIVFLIAFIAYIYPNVIVPANKYNNAVKLLEQGKINEAKAEFNALGDYKDAKKQLDNCEIARADAYVAEGDASILGINERFKKLTMALSTYEKYSDNENVTEEKVNKCKEAIYQLGKERMGHEQYDSAIEIFRTIDDYSDSKDCIVDCNEAIEAKRIAKEKAEKEAKEKAEKEAKEKAAKQAKDREASGLIGTWYAKKIINYRDEDMTDQMGDLSQIYITFNADGTGLFSDGDDDDHKFDFTWIAEKGPNGAAGTWTIGDDSDTIFYYGDHVLVYTDEMDSIFVDMHFFCFK